MKSQADETDAPAPARRWRGKVAYLSGVAAENIVAKAYGPLGARVLESRWRGQAGEIDMILKHGPEIVFCEVKKARSFDTAMARLRPNQMRRIHRAGSEYLAQLPTGQLTEMRFDLAVVNETGQVRIIQNAFGHF